MVCIVYWSGTGTTERMAYTILSGVEKAGGEGCVFEAAAAPIDIIERGSVFAFGCPPFGEESLETEEFEPFFSKIENKLDQKKIGLFGSYGWGGGRWMDVWKQRCIEMGAYLVCEPVICCDEPNGETEEKLEKMGKTLWENTLSHL